MNKYKKADEAVKLIKSGDTVLVGGFGLSGTPLTLLDALTHHHAKELTVISNNLGEEGRGLGKLLLSGQLKKAIGSYFTTNRDAVAAWSRGELEIELIPQGTLAEAIRAGGAGLGGFYTKTAVGTKLAEGKEVREIDGEWYLFQKPLKGDVALIKAAKADKLGNLVYHRTARNFNPAMATAADLVIAEVDEIVETGTFHPEEVVTPHVYVDVVVRNRYVKKGGKYVVPS
ncbi:3-oxoacid CoA-transferase A subunit [Caldalkalibacillus uzonensis]|uniref:3-oxoacid CoA-transferase A subunit n=1 Tax=Caldalkalibacillus uzonensis TaxID=353224 RepID=A0ABU0CWE9_9BACI|nr:CoA transferase subunit A [Caldalkalibacillus uzonensis]MDQ0340747.1 3-oxoacid CoA-transferase A subunit [Caldalkalibacillus uzonensis]